MQRFWSKANIKGPEDCWPWMAAINSGGYGSFGLNGKVQTAHRVAYFLTYGEIPAGSVVRHTCDNPGCVNPSHLLIGTQADNVRDRDKRGRRKALRGTDHPNTNLSAVDVRVIKTGTIYPSAYLARVFGVSHKTITNIQQGVTHARS